MEELKVGERVTITLEVVEQGDSCEGCFSTDKEDAQAVIDNPNFRSILDAIYKD